MTSTLNSPSAKNGYATVNGLTMYYEIEGVGDPVVHVPAAFGYAGLQRFPGLTQRHSVITMDLQGHGRTADIPDRPLAIEQYGADVVALLRHLGVGKADFIGNSYGASAAVWTAVHHPEMVRRVVSVAATLGDSTLAHNPRMLRYDNPPTPDSSDIEFQRQSYKRVAPNPDYWPTIWNKLVAVRWNGFTDDELRSITVPVLVMVGDRDFVTVEHALDKSRLIPGAELAVIPDAGHFMLYSEPERVMPVIQHFLEKPERRAPVATAGMGYHPGESR